MQVCLFTTLAAKALPKPPSCPPATGAGRARSPTGEWAGRTRERAADDRYSPSQVGNARGFRGVGRQGRGLDDRKGRGRRGRLRRRALRRLDAEAALSAPGRRGEAREISVA